MSRPLTPLKHHYSLIVETETDGTREVIEQCVACSTVRHATLDGTKLICMRFFRMGRRIEEPACRQREV